MHVTARPRQLAAIAVLSCIAAFALGACTRPTAEEALRVQLQQMQSAAENRDPSGFMEGVAEDFTGNDGLDRAALHNLLRMHMLANSSVNTGTGPVDVEIRGDRATVRFSVVLAGGSGRFLPERVQTYQITSGWRQEGDTWRVYHAQWSR